MLKLKRPRFGSIKDVHWAWCLFFAGEIVAWEPFGPHEIRDILPLLALPLISAPTANMLYRWNKKYRDNHIRKLAREEAIEFINFVLKQPSTPPSPSVPAINGRQLQEL